MKIDADPPPSYPDRLSDIADGEAFWHRDHAAPLLRTPFTRINPEYMATMRTRPNPPLDEVRCTCLRSGVTVWLVGDTPVCARALQLTEDPNP